VLEISSGAVRTRLHRARRALEVVVDELLRPTGRSAASLDLDTVAASVGTDV